MCISLHRGTPLHVVLTEGGVSETGGKLPQLQEPALRVPRWQPPPRSALRENLDSTPEKEKQRHQERRPVPSTQKAGTMVSLPLWVSSSPKNHLPEIRQSSSEVLQERKREMGICTIII